MQAKGQGVATGLLTHFSSFPSSGAVRALTFERHHTLFYNTINKSGVMNSLVTRSSFSCTLRLSRLATAPPPPPLQPLHFNKTMERLAASVHLGKPQRDR